MNQKFDELQKFLNSLDEQGFCLAFSGGIDSALLLYLAKNLKVEAVTFTSPFQKPSETGFTSEFCTSLNVPQKIITLNPLENKAVANNSKDRCYHCKSMFFKEIFEYANGRPILDGTNFDDLSAYRPGLLALKEFNVISPFAKFKITKSEIREFAKLSGLEIYNKPSFPCLATRFPYNTPLTKELLNKAAKAEEILLKHGFENSRFRIHNDIARVEIPKEAFKSFLLNDNLQKELKALEIKYLTLDIEGLRSGSMD